MSQTADPPAESGAAEKPRDTTRSSALVAAGILVSRLGGLIREIVLAYGLGTSAAADAFRAALRIPQLLQNLLGEGALSAAFIPVYSRLLEEGRERDAARVAGAIAGLIAAVTAGLVLAGALLARPLTAILAPGFTGETYDLTVRLVRIMTAGIGFVVLAAWCLGVLNAHRRFFLSYAAPAVWNLAQIVAMGIALGADASESGLAEAAAWGVLVGGILQFAIQLPAVRRVAPDIRWSLDTHAPEVSTVLRRFGPAALGRGVVQVGAYVDLVLASLLTVGSVAVIDFAQILFLLPVSLFAISVAAAELPELSRTDRDDELGDRLHGAVNRVTFLLTGTTVLFVVGGGALVSALYERGEFDQGDATLVWLTLAAYCVGLVAVGASRLMQNTLFARGDTAGPAKIAVARVAAAAGIGLVLMFQFQQYTLDSGGAERLVDVPDAVQLDGDVPAALRPLPVDERTDEDAPLRLGAVGLALGSGLAAWLEYGLLRRRLRHRAGVRPALATALGRLVPAAVAAIGATALAVVLAGDLPQLAAGIVVAVVGGGAYVLASVLTGVPEARSLARGLGRPQP